MSPESQRVFTPRLILGLLVAVVGVLMLLSNLGHLDADFLGSWWPIVFVVLGVIQLAWGDNPFPRVIGLGLILLGGTLIFAHLNPEILQSDQIWENLWPVVLVVGGGLIIYRALIPHRAQGPGAHNDNHVHIFTFWSGQNKAVCSQQFEGGELTSIMGGYELDLRDADIPDGGEAVLDIFAVMGGGEIRVPEDWTIISEILPIMGGVHVKARTRPGAPDKRLRVKGFAMMGGVEIRN